MWRHDLTARTLAEAFNRHGLRVPEVIECDNFAVTRGLLLDEGCPVIGNRLFFEREIESRRVIELTVPGLSYEVTDALLHRRDTIMGRAALALRHKNGCALRGFADNRGRMFTGPLGLPQRKYRIPAPLRR